LPKSRLPITRIACKPAAGVFQRSYRLSEIVQNGPGEPDDVTLTTANWTQTPNAPAREILFELSQLPRTDTLILETDNGDNPPVELRDFRGYHPVTRVLFKTGAAPAEPMWLLYGNEEAQAPHYDLTLVGAEMLRAERLTAATAKEEILKGSATVAGDTLTGAARYIFWGVLALVVVGLLFLVARLVPKAA
jgi:hypothetical protein